MPAKKWSKQRVIEAIRDWHRKGVPVDKIWRHDRALCAAGHLKFGSWREAQVAAGFQPVNQRWSKERVINEIKGRFPNGLPPEFRWKDAPRLTCAARKRFGSWHDALVAAGLRRGERKVRQPWTRQRVVEAIRSRHEQGLSLSSVWREDKPLYYIAKKMFGTWRLAMEAAGFPLPPARHWTPEGVIREIHSRCERGLTLAGIGKEDRALHSAARRHCGGWRAALQVAGIETKPQRSWSRQSVIDALVDWQARGLSLSRVWTEDRPLYAAAARTFGSWNNALRALGLPPRQNGVWSKQRVILELQAWYGQADARPRAVRRALADAAIQLFGSLDKAMKVAGVEPKDLIWSSRRVIKAIQDGFVRGRPIHFVGFRDKALAAAAQRRFGGWLEAVAAAGLPGKYRKPPPKRAWTKELVIEAILARRWQGLPLRNVSRRDAGLYSAAKQHFGGWHRALAAAGIALGEEAK